MLSDPKAFFESARLSLFHGALAQGQVDGTNTIVSGWAGEAPKADRRFVAYSLATVYHETGQVMQPIRERGEGRRHPYGLPTGPWHQVYYGRGDEQLTWERNYRLVTQRLHELGILPADLDMERTPDLALDPRYAAAILIHGMTEGWFTGAKLADFFGVRSDWIGARAIINGRDCAGQIAVYAVHWLDALKAGGYTALVPAPPPAPEPSPPAPGPAPEPSPPPAPEESLLQEIVATVEGVASHFEKMPP